MDAVVIILSAVVGMGFIAFLKQYEKLKKAQVIIVRQCSK